MSDLTEHEAAMRSYTRTVLDPLRELDKVLHILAIAHTHSKESERWDELGIKIGTRWIFRETHTGRLRGHNLAGDEDPYYMIAEQLWDALRWLVETEPVKEQTWLEK